MKKHRKLTALALAFLFSALFSILWKWKQTGDPFQPETIFYGTLLFLDIIITSAIGYRIFSRYSGTTPKQLSKRILPLFLLFTGMALLTALVLISLGTYLFYSLNGWTTEQFFHQLLQEELPSMAKQFSIWLLIVSVLFFYVLWRETVNREQRLREEKLIYQYRTLKNQVNPHFLFNSLNTLSEIIYEDVRKADSYIRKLSGIYRYLLEHQENDLIPLQEELRFVEDYFSLQKERDGNKIRLTMELARPHRFLTVPASVQLLVENALKHNRYSEENPLEIRIGNENGYLSVSNPIQPKSVLPYSSGKGLLNLKERIRLLTGKELVIHRKDNQFLVLVPLIPIEE